MEIYANYYIKAKHNPDKIIIVTDQNPTGVTIMIKSNSDTAGQESFTLCRNDMIEALEYILDKIKSNRCLEKPQVPMNWYGS